jgi:DNA helicase-2/ATP-dependent DNA helicase PcrA
MPTPRLPGLELDFTAGLNPEQRAVVLGGDGPCVVIAGAGSGKTKTIVHRVAHLIAQGVAPDRILLLTFTNKAAGEMMHRIGELLGSAFPGGSAGVYGGTFHSTANRMLRAFAANIGYTPNFSILDEEDARELLKASLKELGLSGDAKRFPSPAVVKEVISYSLNAMVPLADALESKHPHFLSLASELHGAKERYEKKKRDANAMDFDDLLTLLHKLLATDPAARARISGRFAYLLVDEYQDTNPLQAAIVGMLAGEQRNVLVVGDDAQSIYSFRAADVRNILDFPKQHPGAKLFKLETNYRSSPQVLDLANDVISRNVEQYPKNLRAVKPEGPKPVVVPSGSGVQEAMFIADRIERLIEQGTPSREIAVLCRATFHALSLELELKKRGVEYDLRGGIKFFERAHVKDVLAFMRISSNFSDEAAWMRILLIQQGVGDGTAGKMFAMIRAAGSLAHAALAPIEQALGARAGRGWRDLKQTLDKILEADGKPSTIVKAVLKSAYAEYLESEYPNWRDRVGDIEELATFAEDYESAAELLAETALDDQVLNARPGGRGRGERQDRVPRVVVSTIHQAKGLEWDTVFLIHLTNSSFPNRKAALEEGGMEEERRLFYVAVTRARRNLYLCWPQTVGRDMFGMEQPSIFLEEADPHHLDMALVEKSGWDFGGGSGSEFRGGSAAWGGGDIPRGTGLTGALRHAGASGVRAKPRPQIDDADSGDFFEDDAVDADAPEDPMLAMKARVGKAKEDWKKKSFLREV